MVFSSYVFVFYFLPLVLLLYYPTPQRWKQPLLTVLSYVFYGWANPWFVPLMMFSTVNDYVCGLMIVGKWNPLGALAEPDGLGYTSSTGQRKIAVALSVVTNLGLLGFFKYAGFVQANMNWVFSAFGAETMTVYRVALPLGISFYTFQSMSYSIDLYRGHARPARSLLDFSCYVALFPQLVAGPIVRYSDLAEQLSRRTHTIDKFARGIAFFALGFGKKILLANPMGEVADAAFDAGGLMWYDAWTGAIAYAFQIYFDFSGYSDMAIGLGLMLGFTFPKNFDSPYRARSITEFWARWHMSLSTWLRDYLYVPLGGNRKGTGRTYVNLMLVMILGGLWHGASWTFVVWGGIHGGMLVIERAMGKDAAYRRAPRAVRTAVTFTIVVVSLVFFRAYDLPAAMRYLGAMLGSGPTAAGAGLVASTIYTLDHALVMGACAFIVWGCRQTWEHARSVGPVKAVFLVVLMLWSCAVMFTQTYNPFIYFFF
ncbi:MAG: MBOAT family O-acyltransferase [Planctomycetota bacterium]|jgi:alginate O-acetyltransferase complex protein AlgI